MTHRLTARSLGNTESSSGKSSMIQHQCQPAAGSTSQSSSRAIRPLQKIDPRKLSSSPSFRQRWRVTRMQLRPLVTATLHGHRNTRATINLCLTVSLPTNCGLVITGVKSILPRSVSSRMLRHGYTNKYVKSSKARRIVRPRPELTPRTWVKSAKPLTVTPPSTGLHLRGGGRRVYRTLGDDERVPARLWYFAGGNPRYRPTGKQLKESRKRKNKKNRGGFFRNLFHALFGGRSSKDKKQKKQADPPAVTEYEVESPAE